MDSLRLSRDHHTRSITERRGWDIFGFLGGERDFFGLPKTVVPATDDESTLSDSQTSEDQQ